MKKSALVLLLIASCFISACEVKGADSSPSDSSVSDVVEDSSVSSLERETLVNSKVENGQLYYDSAPVSEDEIKKNIKIETESHGDVMAVMITNNNDFVIPDLELTVAFYENGSLVDSDKDGHDVLIPGNTVASKINVPSNADEFEILIDIDWSYGTTYRNWTDNVSYESNIGNNNVMISFTNNGDVEIEELEYVVTFYKDGEFVGISFCEDVYDFAAGSTIIEEAFAYPVDSFDDYKIFINQAHTFG